MTCTIFALKKKRQPRLRSNFQVYNLCDLNDTHQSVRINNLEKYARDRNLKPRSAKECLKEARAMNGRMVEYSFNSKNCEFYCTLWKYGEGFSVQAENASNGIKSLLSPHGHLLLS